MNAVTILGSGNVAWHLAQAFQSKGIAIEGVWSREPRNSHELASLAGCKVIPDLLDLPDDGSLVLLALPDHVLPDIMDKLRYRFWQHSVFVHTSGATSISILEGPFAHYGVLYPLQTLTKGHPVGPWPIPFLVHGNTVENTERLKQIAGKLSTQVQIVSDEDRAILHLSAVIINNFINHLGGLAFNQLEANGLDRRLLEPLALETIRKLFIYPAREIQTGPAKRGDISSLAKHLQMLANDPQFAALYRQISLSINQGLEI